MSGDATMTGPESAARARLAVVRALLARLRRLGVLRALIDSLSKSVARWRDRAPTARPSQACGRPRLRALGARAHGAGGGGPGDVRFFAAPCAFAA